MKSATLLGIGILMLGACNESRPNPIRPPLDGSGNPCPTTDPNCKPNTNNPNGTTNPYGNPNTSGNPYGNTTGTTPPSEIPSNPPVSGDQTTTNTGSSNPPASECPADSVCKAFSDAEREVCRRFVADRAICDSNRWGKTFYEGLLRDMTCTVQVSSTALRSTASTSASTLATLPVGSTFFKISDTSDRCDEGLNFYRVEATADGTKKVGFVCSKNTRCGQ